MRLLLIATLLCLGSLGCKDAKSSDVSGTWVVNDESRHRFLPSSQQKGVAKIVLDANGTFVASEIPEDLLYEIPQTADGLITGSGVWKLFSREGKEQVQLNFKTITIGPRRTAPYGTQLYVSGRGSAVSLYYFQGGDADQGRRIEFEKK